MTIAMWSGPRNLSTALMYAFGARVDCAVWDEPFYAAFLAATGIDHPMRDEIIAAAQTDPDAVARRCTGPAPGGKVRFYQKHMAHHMVEGFPLDWMSKVRNVILIRHPARVIASYIAKRENPAAGDLGFRQLLVIRERIEALGQMPVVIDSTDLRADPERLLRLLCDTLDMPWDPAMLRWPAGGHPDDGVWAAHWYGAVHRSTGFAGPEGPLPALCGTAASLAEEVMPAYLALSSDRLRV